MNAGCAGKTVRSLENACHTWAPWRCVHDEALYKFSFTFTLYLIDWLSIYHWWQHCKPVCCIRSWTCYEMRCSRTCFVPRHVKAASMHWRNCDMRLVVPWINVCGCYFAFVTVDSLSSCTVKLSQGSYSMSCVLRDMLLWRVMLLLSYALGAITGQPGNGIIVCRV